MREGWHLARETYVVVRASPPTLSFAKTKRKRLLFELMKMEGVDFTGRVPRILGKNQSRDAQLVAAQRVGALVADGGLDRRSVQIIPDAVDDLQGKRHREGGIKQSDRDGAVPGIALVLLTFAGWSQHLYTCFHEGHWEFLIAGAVMTPIGIINGWGIWFAWW